MYQNIDFSKTGGFPLTQNTMDFIQKSYNEVLAAASHALGEYIILEGVEQTSPNNFSNGWVVIEGEILPFVGGNGSANIIITETIEDVTYNDGGVNSVIKTRKAGFGAGTIPFTNFQTLSLETIKTQVDAVETTANNAIDVANDAISQVSSGSIPAGAIMMWAGITAPIGWHLCDGTDGTPNLKGKFIVGYHAGGDGQGDYGTIGSAGGEKFHTLSVQELPTHSHSISTDGSHTHNFKYNKSKRGTTGSEALHDDFSPFPYGRATESAGSHTHSIGLAGDGYEHENRPPYYTLAYIIKL